MTRPSCAVSSVAPLHCVSVAADAAVRKQRVDSPPGTSCVSTKKACTIGTHSMPDATTQFLFCSETTRCE